MKPGTRPIHKILAELQGSNHLLAFLTRDDLNPPWVIFEAGSVNRRSARSEVTPITVGFSPGEVQPPLKIMRQGVAIDDKAGIRKVFESIRAAAGVKRGPFERGFIRWFNALQSELAERLQTSLLGGGKDWSIVQPAKLAEATAGSPFEAEDALRIAKRHLVFTGQNLFGLVGKDRPINRSWFFRGAMRFLKGTRNYEVGGKGKACSRRLDFLVMDPNENVLVEAWDRSIGARGVFTSNLEDCVSALVKFKHTARAQGVGNRVRIRLGKFIPLSTTFIDPAPKAVRGLLFLRPFTQGDTSGDRPILAISAKENPQAFSFYWTRHEQNFTNNAFSRDL